ncbi:MAG: hypothetical protein AAGI53_10250 [Planctomycetota bacterium]
MIRMHSAAVVIGLGAIVMGGCAEPKTTSNDVKRNTITINDLREAASETGQSLASDLTELVRYDFGGERVAMFLGDIDNRTQSVSTNDFDVVQRTMRSELYSNRFFRDNIQLRETGPRTQSLSNRERQASGDPFAEEDGFEGLKVDADYVFFLNGDARKLDRRDATGFFLEMTLTRESNGEIVWTNSYFVQYGEG